MATKLGEFYPGMEDMYVTPQMKKFIDNRIAEITNKFGWMDQEKYGKLVEALNGPQIRIELCGDVEKNPGPSDIHILVDEQHDEPEEVVPPVRRNRAARAAQRKEPQWVEKSKGRGKDKHDKNVEKSLLGEVDRLKAELDVIKEKRKQEKEDAVADSVEKAARASEMSEHMTKVFGWIRDLDVKWERDDHYPFWCDMVPNLFSSEESWLRIVNMRKWNKPTFRHHYVFKRWSINGETIPDLRADSHALLTLKHIRALNATVEYRAMDKYGRQVESKELSVSFEVLSQLLNPKVLVPGLEDELVNERIKYTSENLMSVNFDKYRNMTVEPESYDNVLVAYAIYQSIKDSRRMVPRFQKPALRPVVSYGWLATGLRRLCSLLLVLSSLALLFDFIQTGSIWRTVSHFNLVWDAILFVRRCHILILTLIP
jgi:hypothetical protein